MSLESIDRAISEPIAGTPVACPLGAMTVEKSFPTPVLAPASRRRSLRVPADRIVVEIVALEAAATLVDISMGGFAVETSCTLRRDAVYQFRFKPTDAATIELRARVVHSRRRSSSAADQHYVSGCEFMYEPTVPTHRLIQQLVSAAILGDMPAESS